MTTVNFKIVGTEGDSVLVKYVSENSLKPIDEYDAIAFQPKSMGYSTLQEFVEGIKPNLVALVETRDAQEQSTLNEDDLSSWIDYEDSHTATPVEPVVIQTTPNIPAALPSQEMYDSPEVKL